MAMIFKQGAIMSGECRKAVSAFCKSSLDRLTQQDDLQSFVQRIVQKYMQIIVQSFVQSFRQRKWQRCRNGLQK